MTVLDRECHVLCRYLVGTSPDEYVLSKYRAFHDFPEAAQLLRARAFDRPLLAAARLHPAMTRLADGYARLACPSAVLRKKLVLLLAILESTGPYHRHVTAVDEAEGVRLWANLASTLVLSGCLVLTSFAVFAPWHLLFVALGFVRKWSAGVVPTSGWRQQQPSSASGVQVFVSSDRR